MKITTKTTKEQLKHFLNDNAKAVKAKDKNLYDRMMYTGKVIKEDDSKVTRKELVDLAKETLKLLGKDTNITSLEAKEETPATPVAENSVKKLSKKKQEVKETEPEESDEEEPAEEVKEEQVDTKKSAKKSSLGKKDKPKKDGVTILNDKKNTKVVQMAEQFPSTITVGDATYEIATDIKTMEDLHTALANEEEIVFAYYWTKRHLKQFSYFGDVLGHPKSFDNDLDLAMAIYVSDGYKVCHSVSMSTEIVYTLLPSDLEEEDGIRCSFGIEYQIYRAV